MPLTFACVACNHDSNLGSESKATLLGQSLCESRRDSRLTRACRAIEPEDFLCLRVCFAYAALLSPANERSFGWFAQQKGLKFVGVLEVVLDVQFLEVASGRSEPAV